MTIEQTIEIPVSRRITIDLPHELPVGKAKVELNLTPLTGTRRAGGGDKVHLTQTMIDEMLQGDDLRFLTGILRNETSVEAIRAERVQERLTKHDHIA
jgi:hypothetical protein